MSIETAYRDRITDTKPAEAIAFILAFGLTFVSCGRVYGPVEEVKAFTEEKEEVISQMGKKLDANPTEAGVDEARKIFEAKKASLVAKKEAINAAPQGLNNDWASMLNRTQKRHDEMLDAIGLKFTVACYSDQCQEKWAGIRKGLQRNCQNRKVLAIGQNRLSHLFEPGTDAVPTPEIGSSF